MQAASNPSKPAGDLLTIEQLAERWQTTVDRVYRRLRDEVSIRAVNLGTAKFPELRFRLASVLAWEQQVEQPASVWVASPAGPKPTVLPGGQTQILARVKKLENLSDTLGDFKPRKRASQS